MKTIKPLAALILASTLGAGTAMAAEPTVTLYGVIDTGLQYTHVFKQSTDTFEMPATTPALAGVLKAQKRLEIPRLVLFWNRALPLIPERAVRAEDCLAVNHRFM